MLPAMSATEFAAIDRILRLHEDELIEETLAELPPFILERRPRVMLENTGAGLCRWLMFGRPPRVATGCRTSARTKRCECRRATERTRRSR